MKTELVNLDLSANSFTANGHKYLVHGTLSLGRYKEYEKLQAQISWGVDFEKQYKDLRRAWELLNQMKPAEAAVWINNMMSGVARVIENREHPALLLCTLFICREGEDLTTWDETTANEKIADWKAEGFEMESFFSYAFSLVKGWRETLQDISASTLQGEGERK